jgi:glycine/D-amino acid oxidase-like deaminating enzyme/nitrite reductase/ring-hydroxylating ferredoxin subunit
MLTSNNSVWMDTTPETKYPSFSGDLWVDVAIVGGGISGLTAAMLLRKNGLSVAIVEKSTIATGESGYTTAHLTEVIDTRYHKLISHFGESGARMAALSSRAAIDRIESLCEQHKIDCGFERLPGYLYTEHRDEIDELRKETEAMRKVSVNAEMLDDLPEAFRSIGAIRIENQAQFHPRKYMLGLARLIPHDGSHIFENSKVTEIHDGRPCEVVTERGRIRCGNVLVLTNTPINNRVFLHTKLAAYRTYAIGAMLKEPLPARGLFWDTADPYHYIRTHRMDDGKEMLIVGGEDHKTGTRQNTDECYERLESYLRDRFDAGETQYRWSGQIMEPVDGLPFMGLNSLCEHVYVATGYTGNGMTFGTLAGMILSDLILGRTNPWADLYDATRIKPLAGAAEFISENKDFPAYFVADRLSKGDVEFLSDIQPGEGKLVSLDGKKAAVYRDDKGHVHALNPVCPHLGCHVHWNSAEKSWDCPCHGSRFSCKGEVANGPAVENLKAIEIETSKTKSAAKQHPSPAGGE